MSYETIENPDHWHDTRKAPDEVHSAQNPVFEEPKPPSLEFFLGATQGDVSRVAEIERERIEDRSRQVVRYQVIRGRRLRAMYGKWLEGGDEVTIAHCGDERTLRHYIDRQPVICELSEEELRARVPSVDRNRFQVADRTIIGKHGPLTPGMWITATDLPEQKAEPATAAEPEVRDWTGRVTTLAKPAFGERKAISGDEVLAGLVARGRVIDHRAAHAAATEPRESA